MHLDLAGRPSKPCLALAILKHTLGFIQSLVVYICARVHMHEVTCHSPCRGQRTTLRAFPPAPPTLFSLSSLTGLELTKQPRVMSQQSPGICLSVTLQSSRDYKSMLDTHTHTPFSCRFQESNSNSSTSQIHLYP